MEIESKNNNNDFWPKVTNITLKRAAGTLTENSSAEYDAIQFKNQGNGEYSNILIDGYTTNASAVAVRIQDVNTNNNQVNASKIKLTNVKINGATPQFGGTTLVTSVVFPAGFYTTSTTATGATLTNGAWSTVNGATLLQ
jgi:hypothetical protein